MLPLTRTTVVLALALSACSGPTRYVHPNADLGTIKTVAILPFENMTQDQSSGDKVQAIFTIELLSTRAFEVVEPGKVNRILRDEKVEAIKNMTPDDMKKVGKALGAQGIFIGSVLDFDETRGGTSAPEVTIQLRLVETQTGVTVWAASETRSGTSWTTKLFGVGGESRVEAAKRLIRRQLRTLMR